MRCGGIDKLRTETSGLPDSSDTYASQRPSGENRASRSTNASASSGCAAPAPSVETVQMSTPRLSRTLTMRVRPSGDQSVGSQFPGLVGLRERGCELTTGQGMVCKSRFHPPLRCATWEWSDQARGTPDAGYRATRPEGDRCPAPW
jgi:hypothetical protein